MRSISRFVFAVSSVALLLAGCARREAPPPVPAPGPAPAPALSVSAASYVAEASSTDLFVIQASELAAGRSSSAVVRDLAAMLVRDHRGSSAQLSFAGRRLNLLPAATLSIGHRAMLDQLATTGQFDASYVDQMIRVHERAVRLHGDFARAGDSPTLRPVAEMAAPMMRRHLEALRGLR